jgi:hypothetical protein
LPFDLWFRQLLENKIIESRTPRIPAGNPVGNPVGNISTGSSIASVSTIFSQQGTRKKVSKPKKSVKKSKKV